MDKTLVTLKDSKGTVHPENEKYSIGEGYCLFPFKLKGKEGEFTQCIKKGDDRICATKLSKKGEMKKYAFCEEKKTQVSRRTNKMSTMHCEKSWIRPKLMLTAVPTKKLSRRGIGTRTPLINSASLRSMECCPKNTTQSLPASNVSSN